MWAKGGVTCEDSPTLKSVITFQLENSKASTQALAPDINYLPLVKLSVLSYSYSCKLWLSICQQSLFFDPIFVLGFMCKTILKTQHLLRFMTLLYFTVLEYEIFQVGVSI
ncbi:hypothetical protein RJT34_01577 [Clitoria ternatea]|uniref:Uncharacterized protein n=1 Tax=Clitoria ternatea TaxID=43366 RepID=A0AAN9KH88_CLITE